MQSAIYSGSLRHRRFWPKQHQFTYSLTLFYIDLDELQDLFSHSLWWSLNSVNLGYFNRKDYLAPHHIPLKDAVKQRIEAELGDCPKGAIRVLTNLRLWGFCFNPVSFYYVFEPGAENPSVILAEVNNTPWNQRHSYLITCDPQSGKTQETFAKQFHVSPFNPLAMNYHWVSTAPSENLLVHMENHSDQQGPGCHMDATLNLKRHAWTKQLLHRHLWLAPWSALKVPLAIYWQALKLWLKRVPYFAHPGQEVMEVDSQSSIATASPKIKL